MEFDSKRAVLGSSKTPGGGEAGKGRVGGEHEGKFKARAKHNFSPSRKFSCGHTSSHPCSAVPRLTHSPKAPPFFILHYVVLTYLSRYPTPTSQDSLLTSDSPHPTSEQSISTRWAGGPWECANAGRVGVQGPDCCTLK